MEKEKIYIADGLRMPVSPYITSGFRVAVVCLLQEKNSNVVHSESQNS